VPNSPVSIQEGSNTPTAPPPLDLPIPQNSSVPIGPLPSVPGLSTLNNTRPPLLQQARGSARIKAKITNPMFLEAKTSGGPHQRTPMHIKKSLSWLNCIYHLPSLISHPRISRITSSHKPSRPFLSSVVNHGHPSFDMSILRLTFNGANTWKIPRFHAQLALRVLWGSLLPAAGPVKVSQHRLSDSLSKGGILWWELEMYELALGLDQFMANSNLGFVYIL
jgi:hypothetical protein